MEPNQNGFINGFTPYDEDTNGYKLDHQHLDLSFIELPHPTPDFNPNPGSSSADSPDEFNDCLFNFINQILVEEKMEGVQSLFCDPLKLQATERSLYEALGQEYPSLSQLPPTLGPGPGPNHEHLVDNVFGYSGECSTNNNNSSTSYSYNSSTSYSYNSSTSYSYNSSTSYSNSTHPDWPGGERFDSISFATQTSSPMWSFDSTTSFGNDHMLNARIDSESIHLFNRGMEEASKFLPSTNHLVIDLDKYDLSQSSNSDPSEVVVNVVKDKPSNGLKGRKHYYQFEENGYDEERSSKQSAVYVEDELSKMFDQILLGFKEQHINGNHKSQQNGSMGGSNKNQNGRKKTSKTVDLSTLLVSCAHAVAAGDQRTATKHLNQIRQHASSSGDASQRLAHVFAIAIEARLAGTGSQLYAAKCALQISAVEKLQAYLVYLSACPFMKIAMSFANRMIFEAALTSSTIHIVDFGIGYGLRWPIFIKHLSDLPNTPQLRITGIEYPQSGFRPVERLEETGRRLASYCERFHVPFEFNAIASQNWETIKIEDLKLQRNEFLAVNSLFRLHNLLDETVSVESPRDKVLKLIRDMKPDMFIHSVVNGAYNAPFFVTRFRETLFHYSALFDMFDATIERGNVHRVNFEKEFLGRVAMNVIACEGAERVERPESYKQWQVRVSRAGFKMKALNRELVKKVRGKMAGYHKDFMFDEDRTWILQGWKGRILYASSCWVPA